MKKKVLSFILNIAIKQLQIKEITFSNAKLTNSSNRTPQLNSVIDQFQPKKIDYIQFLLPTQFVQPKQLCKQKLFNQPNYMKQPTNDPFKKKLDGKPQIQGEKKQRQIKINKNIQDFKAVAFRLQQHVIYRQIKAMRQIIKRMNQKEQELMLRKIRLLKNYVIYNLDQQRHLLSQHEIIAAQNLIQELAEICSNKHYMF